MPFITDLARKHALSAISNHVRRKDSLLITGPYGAGKTELLKQIAIPSAVRVSPLGGVYQILGSMCKIYDASPSRKNRYLDMLVNHPRPIIIDEAQHLPEGLYPYLKIIMDAGNSIVMAGLTDLYDKLSNNHADVLSRMTALSINRLDHDDMLSLVPDFDEDAFTFVYMNMDNMRAIMTAVKNCRDYAQQNGIERIDFDVVEQFIIKKSGEQA